MMFYTTCPVCKSTLLQEGEAGLQPVCCSCGATFQVLAEEGFPIASVWVNADTEIQPTPSPPRSENSRPEAEKCVWVPNLVRSVFWDIDSERTRRIHKGFLAGVGMAWLWGFLQLVGSPDPSAKWPEVLLWTVLGSFIIGMLVASIVGFFLAPDEGQLATGEEHLRHLQSVGEATDQGPGPQEEINPEPSASADPGASRQPDTTALQPPGR